jgi:hypothetical protein
MSFTIDQLNAQSTQNLVAQNVEALGLGYELSYLNEAEFEKWKLAFKRSLVIPTQYKQFIELDYRHILDYLLGAMIAKKQFEMDFDGTVPYPGRFGMSRPRAQYFGLGDTWFYWPWGDVATATAPTASAQDDWIHAGSLNLAGVTGAGMGGTAGNAIRILKSAVHVIVGVIDLAVQTQGGIPNVESVQFTVDGKTKPVTVMSSTTAIARPAVVELDEALIFKNKTTMGCKAFLPKSQRTALALWGITYLPEAQTIVKDPDSIDGTTNDMVTTT